MRRSISQTSLVVLCGARQAARPAQQRALLTTAGSLIATVGTAEFVVTLAPSALDETRLAVHLLHRTLPLIVDCADDHADVRAP